MRILEVVGLTKRFGGRVALDAVSFTAEEGQILALFGPRGAGKTTCGHCLSGVIRPDTGRIIFDGREFTGGDRHDLARAGLARTFQVAKGFPRLFLEHLHRVRIQRIGLGLCIRDGRETHAAV